MPVKVNRYLVRMVGKLSLSLSTMLMGRVNAPSSIPPVEVEQGNPSDNGRKEEKGEGEKGKGKQRSKSRESREQ